MISGFHEPRLEILQMYFAVSLNREFRKVEIGCQGIVIGGNFA